jgi:DNA processing protein
MIDPAWVALSLTERIGGKTLRALLDHFGDPHTILAAETDALQRVPGVGIKTAERIRAVRVDQIERDLPTWEQAGVQVIPSSATDYPDSLRDIGDDAPPTLFVRGLWPPPVDKRVAIVGKRGPNETARALAQNVATALVERGYMVVSGLAVGIDTAAHMGALIVPEGQTLAVLGCGVLNVYPAPNERLARVLMERGAMVSEFHPMANPSAANLVARNRVITGLSHAVIVVETEIDGGAMHAARFAQAQGRPLYTFDSPASGNQNLLERGATALRADLSDLPF